MDFYVDLYKDSTFRKKYGAHFTPINIVVEMCTKARELIPNLNLNDFKFLDLASGTGVFAYYFADLLSKEFNVPFKNVVENNCVMMELDKEFISKCKEIFSKRDAVPNIIEGDALFGGYKPEQFDLVLSNPPYVRIQELDSAYRKKLQGEYVSCSAGSADLYYAFMQLGFYALKYDGVFAFITPSSYLRTDSGENIRLLLHGSVVEIKDFGSEKLFDCSTYSAITYAVKNPRLFFNDKYFSYYYEDKKYLINNEDLKNKLILDDSGGVPLYKICKISNGIATLRDKVFIIKPDSFDENYAYFNGFKLEKESLLKFIKVSKLKDEADISKSPYWCIYPYKGGLDNRKSFSEEELKATYPYTFNYLLYNKEELLERDKGIDKGYNWFEFGRSQGLKNYKKDCIITSTMNYKPNFIKTNLKNCLIGSGLVLHKIRYDIDALLDQLNSNKMADYIEINGAKFGQNWRGYNSKLLRKFKVERPFG
jgi:hypothetical protein